MFQDMMKVLVFTLLLVLVAGVVVNADFQECVSACPDCVFTAQTLPEKLQCILAREKCEKECREFFGQ
jgi:hypothetical protein